jgi:5-methylcytosine-specific restriction protein A
MRNPIWLRDELILALELYLSNRALPPGKTSQPVAELSALLNRLNAALGRSGGVDFRNPNGVYMKMMNFRRFDPEVTSSGRVGLPRGNKEEAVIWADFADDLDRLQQVARAIRAGVDEIAETGTEPITAELQPDAEEGRLLTVLHLRRERNQRLVEKRKEAALQSSGSLRCEACDFDFTERYGDHGHGFIEAHHVQPLHTLTEPTRTKPEDLALLCANCHRMVHRNKTWLSLDELKRLIRPTR